jgi:membrane associated rhomboid family serine protease/Zn-finger nucleic acid-binding protein
MFGCNGERLEYNVFTCPRCQTTLNKRAVPSLGLVWVCPSCRGRAMTLELLRKAVSQPVVARLWQRACSGQYPAGAHCPTCYRRTAQVPILSAADKTTYLDVCVPCHVVWFDMHEFEALPKLPPKPSKREELSPQAREALALARVEAMSNQSGPLETISDPPDYWWQTVIAALGMPVEYNDTPLRNRPLATWLLAALVAVVSLAAFGNLDAAVRNWGLVPAEFMRHGGLTFVSSFFLHGGLFHLLGNLYFLIVFGDNTEDILGRRRYLLLIVAAALVGDVAHILTDPHSTIPCIGASGGISGVLAYYCLRFPTANVGVFWWFPVYRWFRIPVWLMFVLWVLWQISGAFWFLPGVGDVAVFAHLGGAGAGVVFWLWTRRSFSADAASLAARPVKAT